MGCDALLLLRWHESQIAFRLALSARPLHLNVKSSITKRIPCILLSFSVLVAVAVECDVFHDTFPWDYSTHNILFPFCYAGSQSSTMSHQLRTNQRDPSYPHSINKRDVLNDIRHSTIHHFHRFLGSRSNHSSIHSTILMRLLFFHASHFPVRDWSSPQPSFCCLVDSLRLYTRTVLYLFLPPANLLYSYPSSSCDRLLLLQLNLQIVLPTIVNQLCLSRLYWEL